MLIALIGPILAPTGILSVIDDPDEKDDLILHHRESWADNGDSLSWHYTGAESTQSAIIRKGGGGLWSVLYRGKASLTRFYM